MKADLNWQSHSLWAKEAVERLFNSQSSLILKKILGELPKNPAALTDSSLAMSASFAIHCLEAFAEDQKNKLNSEEKAALVKRCLCIFTENEARPNLKFPKSIQKKVVGYLIELDTDQNLQPPSWSWFFNEETLVTAPHLSIANTELNPVEELTYANEPFLAWKKIKDSQNELPYLEMVNFGLFADPEMIKYEIRKSKTDADALFFLYLVLIARGDLGWLKDHTLSRSLKNLFSYQADIGKILNLLISLNQNDPNLNLANTLLLRDLLTRISRLSLPEQKLVSLAALQSIARKKRWVLLSERLLECYRCLSLQLSSGLTDNLWKLANSSSNRKTPKFLSQISSAIPSSKMARTLETTSITFKLISLLGSRKMAKIMSGQAHSLSLSKKEIENTLKILISYFSMMKGPMMKLGQTLSYTHFGLPPQLFAQLKPLQSESSPLDFETIYKEIQKNGKLNSLITFIDSFPIGVGSLGQVHRARLKDGREVAVKVKFPNIEKIIQKDFEVLSFVISLIEMFIPRFRLKAYLKELQQQISLECDYLREARSQTFHREKMKYLKSLYIPEVYTDLSSEHILVSEYIEGMKLEEACRTATQAQKDLWGKTLVEYTVVACRDGHFNSDPHPGNLLFQKDRLVYLDFGSVREWDAQVSNSWNYLIMTSLLGNEEFVLKAFAEFERADVSGKAAHNLTAVLKNPVPGSWTMPGKQALSAPSLSGQLSQFAEVASARKNGVRLPKEFLLGMRVYFGHLSVVSTLGSQADWFEMANRIMSPWSQQRL